MTVQDLINKLEKLPKDKRVIVSFVRMGLNEDHVEYYPEIQLINDASDTFGNVSIEGAYVDTIRKRGEQNEF